MIRNVENLAFLGLREERAVFVERRVLNSEFGTSGLRSSTTVPPEMGAADLSHVHLMFMRVIVAWLQPVPPYRRRIAPLNGPPMPLEAYGLPAVTCGVTPPPPQFGAWRFVIRFGKRRLPVYACRSFGRSATLIEF